MPQFFAAAPAGTEAVLAQELESVLECKLEVRRGGVAFSGDLRQGYLACLWSRVASRIMLVLAEFEADDDEALYQATRALPWSDHLGPEQTVAIDSVFSGPGTAGLTSPRFVALRCKDALVDRLRQDTGSRPDVDRRNPDLRINVFRRGSQTSISLLLSGRGMHRRGFGRSGTIAPLRETLAAALLRLAGWGNGDQPLVDLMCGSGTFVLEAAAMARSIAPGLHRKSHGFERWRGHDETLWQALLAIARGKQREASTPPIFAFDASEEAIAIASKNAQAAGLHPLIAFEQRTLQQAEAPTEAPGLVVVNPPYGERLGQEQELGQLYELLGNTLRRKFCGWSAWVLSGNPALAKRIGLHPAARHVVFNGKIECRWLSLPISSEPVQGERPSWQRPSEESEMFKNRLRKNLSQRRRWARRTGTHCYRVYDADIPQYNVVVDWYDGVVCLQEYQRPRSVDAITADRRLRDAQLITAELFELPNESIITRVRRRQVQGQQYQKLAEQQELHTVREGKLRFLINTTDYLDPGLFLDQRLVRRWIAEHCQGQRFLNLFAYTCSASVHAAAAGARSTTSVDLSNRYLEWGQQNFRLNKLLDEKRHHFLRGDCLRWLPSGHSRFDLIFVSPPSYSRSKAMQHDFDIQRDQEQLLQLCAQRLSPKGQILFSSPLKGFSLADAVHKAFDCQDLTRKLTDEDFRRARAPQQCFLLTPHGHRN